MEVRWTSVLLGIFACAVQQCGYYDSDAGEDYHIAAFRLGKIADMGGTCLLTLQRLMYRCYWLKSGGQLRECRHALMTAYQEALEQGLHEQGEGAEATEMLRNQRREIWCALETWDWLVIQPLRPGLLLTFPGNLQGSWINPKSLTPRNAHSGRLWFLGTCAMKG